MVQKRDQLHGNKGGHPGGGSVTQETLATLVPDLADWPRSWRYEERDVLPGEQIVACFTPFLLHLLGQGVSRKTLRKHRDNLWRLGGELIRALQEDARLRKQPIDTLVHTVVGNDGGPLLSHGDSGELEGNPAAEPVLIATSWTFRLLERSFFLSV
jgi:hypothetical protein